MGQTSDLLATINTLLWPEQWILVIVATGFVFTIWSGFSQYRALTHGVRVIGGDYDDSTDPGAISHFQALAAALSGTVGLGNIGGVALAISLGGPGAIFWMWVIGVLGMALKMTEVTMTMLYRNTDDPDNPHGGPMWVASLAMARINPRFAGLGRAIGIVFCLSLLTATCTGGNMFQAWNVGEVTGEYFGVPAWACGLVLTVLVAAVIIGGIKRIGRVAGTLVPAMCALYLLAGIYVLIVNAEQIPEMFALIIDGAFNPTDASGAFIGGTAASAFLFGMKRAMFSNEAGIGTSPMAHAAARTDEPAREGIVAGLEPFIDTIVVCTFTALIILSTGVWNRAPDVTFEQPPSVSAAAGEWHFSDTVLPPGPWQHDETVMMIVAAGINPDTGADHHAIAGKVSLSGTAPVAVWASHTGDVRPTVVDNGLYRNFVGATLTAKAFDTVVPGLGKWLLTVAAWLFAFSTIVTWSYYGEQGVNFIAGKRAIMPYRLVYCLLPLVATLGWIESDRDLDNLSGIGTGVMVMANLPIMWIFGYQAMRAYRDYVRRLQAGSFSPPS